jgi:hypothetical protein
MAYAAPPVARFWERFALLRLVVPTKSAQATESLKRVDKVVLLRVLRRTAT